MKIAFKNSKILMINGRTLTPVPGIGPGPEPPQPTVYTVTIVQPTGGTITATPISGTAGTVITLSQTPDSSYTFNNFTVDGVAISGNTFTLNGNVTVSASYTEQPYVPDIYATAPDVHVVSITATGDHTAGVLPSLGSDRRYDVLKMNVKVTKQYNKGIVFLELGTDYKQQGEFPYNLNNLNRFILPFILTDYSTQHPSHIGPYCVCRGCGPFSGVSGIASGTVYFGSGVGNKTIYYDPNLDCQTFHALKLLLDTQTGVIKVYWDRVFKGQGAVTGTIRNFTVGEIYTADFGEAFITNIERAYMENESDAIRW